MQQETIDYIISFLLYGDKDAAKKVGYTADSDEGKKYKVVIKPSENSPLINPEKNWQDFYPEVERIILSRCMSDDMDIISFVCFFLSRAEETIINQRDQHGRFLACHSLLGKHNLLNIPLIDEYSRHLLKRLGRPLPEQKISNVNLTHDVDCLCRYRSIRGFAGGIKRGKISEALSALKDRRNDPAWTFEWLTKEDNKIHGEQIYFLKAGNGKIYDYPQYDLFGSDCKAMLSLIKSNGAKIGLHVSYAAGEWSGPRPLMQTEKQLLERAIDEQIYLSRHHYLRSTSIDNMQQLADIGITDDYTMGFADRAGFRMLTCRPVRWINPKTLKVTNLTLHPLTVMDCTLSSEKYMNLTEDEAYYICEQLIDKTCQNSGELTLLWHNDTLNTSYHRSLYSSLIAYISKNYNG